MLNSLIEVASERNLRLHSHALDSVIPFPYQDLFDWVIIQLLLMIIIIILNVDSQDEDYRIIFINAYSGVSQMIACEVSCTGSVNSIKLLCYNRPTTEDYMDHSTCGLL